MLPADDLPSLYAKSGRRSQHRGERLEPASPFRVTTLVLPSAGYVGDNHSM
jgi:hypothetical protein